jgi:HAD superfamily hydrolase (TIGR01509 family)
MKRSDLGATEGGFVMFNSIQGVIFDLDGTLVDSMWIWKQIDIDYLDKRGLNLPADLQKEIEGMSFTETAHHFKERFSLTDTIEEIKEEWLGMAEDFYARRIALKKGVIPFLTFLKENNIKIGIGTSNARELAEAVLRNHNILHYFDSIRTSCEVEKGKPHPDVFLKVAEDLQVIPEQCLVFEDTYAGVLAGKRAGMQVVAIADEHSSPYKHDICSLADKYIEDYEEIA